MDSPERRWLHTFAVLATVIALIVAMGVAFDEPVQRDPDDEPWAGGFNDHRSHETV